MRGRMQDWRDAGCRKGGVNERKDAGLEVFRMQERRGEREEGCRTGGMQDAGKEG